MFAQFKSAQLGLELLRFLTGPDYLRTVKMRLLQGRFLSEHDDTKSPCVAVIDSNFARASFGPCAIIGIVNQVRYAGLQDSGPANQYQAYYSLYQFPDQWVPLNYSDASIIVRTPLDAATLKPAIKSSGLPWQ